MSPAAEVIDRVRHAIKSDRTALAHFDLLVGRQVKPCPDAVPHRIHLWIDDGLSYDCEGIRSPGEIAAERSWPELGLPPFPREGTDGRLTYSLRTAAKPWGPQIVLWCHPCDRWISGGDGYSIETVQQRVAQHEAQDADHAAKVAAVAQ